MLRHIQQTVRPLYVLYMYIVFTVSQFHTNAHSVYLVSNCLSVLFDTTILSESMNISLTSSLASPFSPSCPPLTF